jgi:molybdopterin synthase catalytic subunit
VTKWPFSRRSPVDKPLGKPLRVRIQEAPFDVGAEMRALRMAPSDTNESGEQWDLRVGAVACFVGTVRDINEGDKVKALTLEHYPGMTQASLEDILDQAHSRWPIFTARVIHRIGSLQPADEIVWVGVTSAHREAALAACAFIMDFLKSKAPFWKKESIPQGDRWVAAREKDEEATKRW